MTKRRERGETVALGGGILPFIKLYLTSLFLRGGGGGGGGALTGLLAALWFVASPLRQANTPSPPAAVGRLQNHI